MTAFSFNCDQSQGSMIGFLLDDSMVPSVPLLARSASGNQAPPSLLVRAASAGHVLSHDSLSISSDDEEPFLHLETTSTQPPDHKNHGIRKPLVFCGLGLLVCVLIVLPTFHSLTCTKPQAVADDPQLADATKDISFEASLADLTRQLYVNPETSALPSFDTKDQAYHFPALSSSLLRDAFGGKRLAVVGDSTSYFPFRWMQTLLTNFTQTEQDSLLSISETLAQANSKINPESKPHVGWAKHAPHVIDKLSKDDDDNSTSIVWDGFRGGPRGHVGDSPCHFDGLWKRIEGFGPDVMVVNFGLHWLHLVGARPTNSCKVQRWLQYEDWLEEVVSHAHSMGVKLLLFKTNNQVCTEKYKGGYAVAAKAFQEARQARSENDALDACFQRLRKQVDSNVASDIDLQRYCLEGTLDKVGVEKLNERLEVFVQNKKQSDVSMKVALYNDHDLQTCEYTDPTDGRHYHPLNLIRIRLLAHMVNALYPQ